MLCCLYWKTPNVGCRICAKGWADTPFVSASTHCLFLSRHNVCFCPISSFSQIQVASTGGGDSSAVEFSAREQNFSSEAKVDDVWFGEGRAPFAPAERGSFEKIAEHPECYRGWSLLVCWPSDGEWPEGCLRTFRGDDFFFVGEAEGGATRMPWRLMREEWKLERRVEIPRWPGFHDALWWYRRRGAAPLPRAR